MSFRFSAPISRSLFTKVIQFFITFPLFYTIILFSSSRFRLDSADADAIINLLLFFCPSSPILDTSYIPRLTEPVFTFYARYSSCPTTHIAFYNWIAVQISFLFSLYLSLLRRISPGILICSLFPIYIASYNFYHLSRQSLFFFLALFLYSVYQLVPRSFRICQAVLSTLILSFFHNVTFLISAIGFFIFYICKRIHLLSNSFNKLPRLVIDRRIFPAILFFFILCASCFLAYSLLISNADLYQTFVGLFYLNPLPISIFASLSIQLFLFSLLSLLLSVCSLIDAVRFNLAFTIALVVSYFLLGSQQTLRILWAAPSLGYFFYLTCLYDSKYTDPH